MRAFQQFLRAQSLTFACAESCTGGLLSREMTSVAGSSDVFWGGVVSYANEAKERLLGVPRDLIQGAGAVSPAVASAMVAGLVRLSGVPLAVSVTGVAGPGGGTPEKPVGTVWFGLSARRGVVEKQTAVLLFLEGDRASIQRQSARWARILASRWWLSGMELDSLRSLTDNERKPIVEASSTLSPPIPNPL